MVNTKSLLLIGMLLAGIFLSESALLYDPYSALRYASIATALLTGIVAYGFTASVALIAVPVALLLLLLFLQICSALNVHDSSAVFPELQKTMLLLGAVLFLPNWFKQKPALKDGVLKSLLLVCLVWNIVGMMDYHTYSIGWKIPEKGNYLVASVLANKNLYAAALMLTIPISAIAFFAFRGSWRLFAFATAFINLLLVLSLQTRSVWIAALLIILTAFLGFLWYALQYREQAMRFLNKYRSWIFSGIALIILISFFEWKTGIWSTIENKVHELASAPAGNLRSNSVSERYFLWNSSMEIIKEHPLLGNGAGNWKTEINKFGVTNTAAEFGNVNFLQPHNDFLCIASESGIPALIVYLCFFLFLFITIGRKIKRRGSRYTEQVMLFAGLLGYLTYAFFEFPKDRPEHLALLGIYLGFILMDEKKEDQGALQKSSKLVFGIGTLLLVAVLGFNSYDIYAEYNLLKLNNARFREAWNEVLLRSDKLNPMLIGTDMNGVPVSWYAGIAHFNLADVAGAKACFENACLLSPYNIHVLNNLGTCYAIVGDTSKAAALYKRALAVSDVFDECRINYCLLLFNEGHSEQCLCQLKKITDLEILEKNLNLVTAVLDPQKIHPFMTGAEAYRFIAGQKQFPSR